jgi:hypothetical protein
LTIPNVKVNLFKDSPEGTCTSRIVGFFAGDWSEMDKLLHWGDAEQDKTASGDTEGKMCNGYDIILMAETVYALSSLPNLYRLIKKVNIQNFHFAEYSFSNIRICLISSFLHTELSAVLALPWGCGLHGREEALLWGRWWHKAVSALG